MTHIGYPAHSELDSQTPIAKELIMDPNFDRILKKFIAVSLLYTRLHIEKNQMHACIRRLIKMMPLERRDEAEELVTLVLSTDRKDLTNPTRRAERDRRISIKRLITDPDFESVYADEKERIMKLYSIVRGPKN